MARLIAGIGLAACMACVASPLERPLVGLDPRPLPGAERTLRIRSTTYWRLGPVLVLEARRSKVSGEFVDFNDETFSDTTPEARRWDRDWIEWASKRYGCEVRRVGAVQVCRSPFRRGKPDWAEVMRKFETLLASAPPPGTPPKNVVCTDGSGWELQYRTSAGRRTEETTHCWAVEPERRTFEAAIDTLFIRVMLQAEVAERPRADTAQSSGVLPRGGVRRISYDVSQINWR